MAVAVTDTGATLTINDGNSVQSPNKNKITVASRGDNVRVQWDDTGSGQVDKPYTEYTAPTGASAVAVATAIEAFLETSYGAVSISGSLPAGTNNIGVLGSNAKPAATSITRAANTTTYAVNDVMNDTTVTTMLAFTVSRANDLKGWIVGGKAVSSAAQATLPNIDLLLFSSNFAIAADNAAFAPTYAQMQTYLGKVRFQTWVNRGVRCESDGSVESSFQFTPASGTQIIYGVLVVQNAYIPVSAETLQFFLDVEQY